MITDVFRPVRIGMGTRYPHADPDHEAFAPGRLARCLLSALLPKNRGVSTVSQVGRTPLRRKTGRAVLMRSVGSSGFCIERNDADSCQRRAAGSPAETDGSDSVRPNPIMYGPPRTVRSERRALGAKGANLDCFSAQRKTRVFNAQRLSCLRLLPSIDKAHSSQFRTLVPYW